MSLTVEKNAAFFNFLESRPLRLNASYEGEYLNYAFYCHFCKSYYRGHRYQLGGELYFCIGCSYYYDYYFDAIEEYGTIKYDLNSFPNYLIPELWTMVAEYASFRG